MKPLWGVWIGCSWSCLLLLSACSGHSQSDTESVAGSGSGGANGAAGTSGSTTGHAGTTSNAECATAADCPAPHSICRTATCIGGVCGTGNAVIGALPRLDVPADCQETICDGNGGLVQVPFDGNVPPAPKECVVSYCDGAAPMTKNAAPGAPCTDGGSYCDGKGHCRECVESSDCASGGVCMDGACVAGSCSNGARDGSETDIDCGGNCPACATGKSCKLASDCATKVCDASTHECDVASCNDGVLDQDETDIDCGGRCKSCPNTADCFKNADCASGACDAWSPHRCLADHCADHRIDFDETDLDCGGSCSPCARTQACKVDADCASFDCDHTHGERCIPASCKDGVKDNDETDLDCGGSCGACAIGKKCTSLPDCVPHACDFQTLICVADPCLDHGQDGLETDVDCGGANTCARCAPSQKCLADSDCMPGHACSAPPRVCQ